MALRFKLDENLPARAAVALQDRGHDVETATSEGLGGANDAVVLAACVAEDRILVTLDLDFSDIRAYPPGSHRGIGVLRPGEQTFDVIVALALAAALLSATEQAAGRLWIVDEQRVRIRD